MTNPATTSPSAASAPTAMPTMAPTLSPPLLLPPLSGGVVPPLFWPRVVVVPSLVTDRISSVWAVLLEFPVCSRNGSQGHGLLLGTMITK